MKRSKRPASVTLLLRQRHITVQILGPEGEKQTHRIDIQKELSLNPDRMAKIIEEHPSQVYFWNEARQVLIAAIRDAEHKYDQCYNSHYLAYRHRYLEKGDTFTDQLLKSESLVHDKVVARKEALDDLKNQLGRIQAICEALEHRRSSIEYKKNFSVVQHLERLLRSPR